ncbi:hypothetical protein BH10ACI3_BH10ACI3_17170 [soil metagenome]
MRNVAILLTLFGALTISAFAQPGKIIGKLTYPSDGIPRDMVLCVKVTSLYAEPTYCSNDKAERLKTAKITFKLNYRAASYVINLPAASYYLYATTSEMPGVKAYYDEFVKCEMSVESTSKAPIVIKVKPNQTRSGITVGDFW